MRTVLVNAFIVMLILKLANVVTWSWWIITFPVWINAVIFTVAVGSCHVCQLWDKHMGFVPKIPLFWFDKPQFALPKIAILSIGLFIALLYN